jgi:hypothetical protein
VVDLVGGTKGRDEIEGEEGKEVETNLNIPAPPSVVAADGYHSS